MLSVYCAVNRTVMRSFTLFFLIAKVAGPRGYQMARRLLASALLVLTLALAFGAAVTTGQTHSLALAAVGFALVAATCFLTLNGHV
jgi:hypothetical protein